MAKKRPLYDYEEARKGGGRPNQKGKWGSRNPKSGRILKREDHPTFHETLKGEEKEGYRIYRHRGSQELYSWPKGRPVDRKRFKRYKP